MPAPADRKIPITFKGLTARYSEAELAELNDFPQTDEGEAFAAFVHEFKSIDDEAELIPTGPRLALGRY